VGGSGDGRVRFPALPILNAGDVLPPAPRGQREKYGALFYLGIAGLLILIVLVGWFGYAVWSHRDIWADVYTLHDSSRSEAERIEAARRLSQEPRLADAQKMEMSLRRDLPELARYLLAEAVTTEAVARDPRAYAMAMARSPGWPDWLRLVLARRLSYGASRGYDIPREPLEELRRHSDPMVGLWAAYALARLPRPDPDPAMVAELEKAAGAPGPEGALATRLLDALRAPQEERERRLDEATVWLRSHHSQAVPIWRGWTFEAPK
jgi:hypothetical protein